VTIQQRLMALIVASTLIIVAVLTSLFASSRMYEIEAKLHGKAATYSQLVGHQLMSAVAFSDRETAREVLGGLANDDDIASVQLLGASDVVLFKSGTPAWHGAGTIATDRIIYTTPIVSLEGPAGTFVIELSTERASALRRHVLYVALLGGGIALACGVVMAWLIARGLARRLRAIGDVATAVAHGDLDQPPLDTSRRDEVGVLATAFNAMVAQLKQHIWRAQERLAKLVAERTDALEARTREMRLVFDQVDQGLLVVDLDGTIASDCSAAVERWLGKVPASRQLGELVRTCAPAQADWFAVAWGALADDILPLELAVTQLPARFEIGGRHLAWSYKPFDGKRMLIVISDVTAELASARHEQGEREAVSLLGRALRDRAGFVESFTELERLVSAVARADADLIAYARDVHTLKGVAGLLELVSLADACHALETALAEADDEAAATQRRAIAVRWSELAELVAPFVAGARDRVDVLERELAELDAAIARNAAPAELMRLTVGWRHDRATDRLARIAELARTFADRLGKAPLEVVVECDPALRLSAELAPLWSTLAHAVRNAIDHGIEAADARVAAGKPRAGTLVMRASRSGGELAIEVSDDGRGIAWDRVAVLAAERGLPASTHAELEAVLFSDGVSTRDDVSEVSGRGVGLAALRATCEVLGARASIASVPGAGTTLRIVKPPRAARTTAKAS
jgi:two-component system, chemotaxis family, sensor kinase CheA